jgi:hypothetical protein
LAAVGGLKESSLKSRSLGRHGEVKGTVFSDGFINIDMSQAFVKESEEQWLHEVGPSVNALVVYLTKENNGIRVYELSAAMDVQKSREVYKMSNGLSYAKDKDSRWEIVD